MSRSDEIGSRADSGEITQLLKDHRAGDESAFDRLVPLVYDQLRVLARQQLSRWRRRGELETTGLMHEAYLRLVDQSLVDFTDREHFYAVTARAMRLILVDHARAANAQKRGGGQAPATLERFEPQLQRDVEEALAIDQALTRLETVSSRLSTVFECRYFGGLTVDETARTLGVSVRTVERDWMKAKAWLRRELEPD